jgi:hypothetical protein
MSTGGFGAAYLVDIARAFSNYKALGDGALAQVPTPTALRTS